MTILGISGSIFGDRWDEPPSPVPYRSDFDGNHDSAAVLLRNGKVIAAVEQERLDRIKHSGGFPFDAISECLRLGNCSLRQVDRVATSYSYSSFRTSLLRFNVNRRAQGVSPLPLSPEFFLKNLFKRTFKEAIDPTKVRFVKHHFAHASSAFWPSGYSNALVVTIDGHGEDESGSICVGKGDDLTVLTALPDEMSLGMFYLRAINLIGFRLFDEYKAMGLAPYGKKEVYDKLISQWYQLLPHGKYSLYLDKILDALPLIPRRGREDSFEQIHKDYAASVQSALEKLVFHLLTHYRNETGIENLCLAGGVAHNCSVNGKLRASGLFKNIFVQPASHDGGLALGAALSVYRNEAKRPPKPMPHVFLGTSIDDANKIRAYCNKWSTFLKVAAPADIIVETARRLATGQIVGWMQGRAEFGPRALGNRSILADPRPAKNKRIINALVKKRESFRPFAPAIIEEAADGFIEGTMAMEFPYMTFVVRIKRHMRARLGAVCHVDGTARVQTVSRTHNPRFWDLLKEFGGLSGIPILLNTSFNSSSEPIVNCAKDGISTFLTTKLDALVIGGLLITRRRVRAKDYAKLCPLLLKHIAVGESTFRDSIGNVATKHEIRPFHAAAGSYIKSTPISREVYFILTSSNGEKTIEHLIHAAGARDATRKIIEDLVNLWAIKVIELNPK